MTKSKRIEKLIKDSERLSNNELRTVFGNYLYIAYTTGKIDGMENYINEINKKNEIQTN